MPIIASAKKQLRQSIKRNIRNNYYKKLYAEARVSFEKAIKAGDAKAARSVYVNTDGKAGLQSLIDKLVKKNIIHPNNGARKKARFARMLKAADQA